MTTYNTGNPVGSAAPKDLYDNSENLDELVNSPTRESHPDRLGVDRKTWHGMESEFDADQAQRGEDFQQFLLNSGYVGTGTGGAYEDYDIDGPLEIIARNQIFTKDGEFYRAKASLTLPYTTTGTWVGDDEARFVSVGDAALRQELSEDSGVFLVKDAVAKVANVTDLLAVDGPVDGQKVSVTSYHADWIPAANPVGGGEFVWVADRDKADHDGGYIISPTVPWDGGKGDSLADFLAGVGETDPGGKGCWVREVSGSTVEVAQYGAQSGTGDDQRSPLQRTIDRLVAIGGGTFLLNPGPDYYVQSEHPDHPGHALVVDGSMMTANNFNRGNIKFLADSRNTRIILDTPDDITSLMYWPVRLNNMKFEGFYLDADGKADHAWLANNEYSPYIDTMQSTFRGGKVSSADIATFTSTFTRTIFGYSDLHGLTLGGIGAGPATSCTFNSCYSIQCPNGRGFDFGYLTYCTLNACAGDHNGLTYYWSNARGCAMNGCGSESSDKAMLVDGYRGFTVNSFFGLNMGTEAPDDPTDYMIEFVAGQNATVSGLRFENTNQVDYILASTGDTFGSEGITVTDRSVTREDIFFVPSIRHNRPIKILRDDETERVYSIPVSTAEELREQIRLRNDYVVHYDYTIQCADGNYDLSADPAYIERVSGEGAFIIAGNEADNTAVVLQTNFERLQTFDCSARIVLKDLTLDASTGNNSFVRFIANRSSNVVLDNVRIVRGGVNVGYGVRALEGSVVRLINGTEAVDQGYANATWDWDDTSRIDIGYRAAPPASGAWTAGMRFEYKSPAAGGKIGAVCTSSGVPGTWKDYGGVDA